MMRGLKLIMIMCAISLLFFRCPPTPPTCERPASKVITNTFNQDGFNNVVFSTVGDVIITDDTVFHIKAIGPENIVNNLRFEIEQTKLVISSDACFTGEYTLTIGVGLPDLKGVAFTGTGSILSRGVWTGDSFSFVHGGVGKMQATVSSDSIFTEAYGTGSITLNGSLGKHYIASTSVVQFNGYGLETELTDIISNGSADAYIKANSVLRVLINGVGNIYYKGQPIVDSKINGTGKLINDN